MTSKQKAAILLVSLPPEVSAQVFREFKPEEVQQLSLEISKLPNISPEMRAQIIEEFLQTTDLQALGLSAQPASAFSSSVVERPGHGGIGGSASGKPLDFLRRVDPHHLVRLMRKEHPQTIALILAQLPSSQAAAVLGEMSPALQNEVAWRRAEIGKIAPEVLQEVERILESRLYSLVEEDDTETDGKDALLEILSHSDRSTEERIIAGLTTRNPELAADVTGKICEFEDLLKIDDGSLQQVLRLTDIRDLVLSLKGANRELSTRLYTMMTPEAAKALQRDVEGTGTVPHEEIRGAQQQIRNVLRGLVRLGKVKFIR